MKKTLAFMLMLGAVVYGISAQSGEIRELTGEVSIKAAGKTAFTAAKAGDKIARDTIVSTGFKSTAVIAVGSSVITVKPLTRLSLAEIQSTSGTESLNVSLQTGRVRVDVKPPAGTKANTTVQGPSATASVRGTNFDFDTMNITVNEGTVAFRGTSGPAAMVNAGESNSVGANGMAGASATASLMPSSPVGMTAARAQTPSSSLSTGNVIVILDK